MRLPVSPIVNSQRDRSAVIIQTGALPWVGPSRKEDSLAIPRGPQCDRVPPGPLVLEDNSGSREVPESARGLVRFLGPIPRIQLLACLARSFPSCHAAPVALWFQYLSSSGQHGRFHSREQIGRV